MRWFRLIAAGLLVAFFCGSCSKNKPAPTIESLRFPVVILFGNASLRLCPALPELTRMHSNYLNLNNETPVLIDSDFNIYGLDHFRSVHNGLWLMANPSAVTEVAFELIPQPPGRENARALFARHLQKQTWREDLEAIQQALSRSQNLLEMAQVVQPHSE